MKDFKTVAPKQRYMSIEEIYKAFGDRAVVAYSCELEDGVPAGGYVVAVANESAPGQSTGLAEYHRQFALKYTEKAPVYRLRARPDETGERLTLTYDGGAGEKSAAQKIELKISAAEEAISSLPYEIIAEAVRSALKGKG